MPGATGSGLTCYSYDLVGNVTSVKVKVSTNCTDAGATFESGLSFGYDLMSRQTSAGTLAQSTSGQPVTTIGFSYDADSNRWTMTDPQNGITNYTYDALNRLGSISNPLGQLTSFSYDTLSRRRTISYPLPPPPGSLQSTIGYDTASQLTSLAYTLGAANLLTLGYTQYDEVGNRRTITEQHGTNPVGTNTYGYDNLYRETSGTHPQPSNPPENYTYDAVGNRLTSQLPVGPSCVDAANRLFYDGTYGYTYDADGNNTLLCIPTSPPSTAPCPATWVPPGCQVGTTISQSFDNENRLIQVTLPNNTTVTYKYDGLGRRIEKNEVGTITRYIYDNENLFETFTGNNVLQQRFTRGLGVDELISFDWGMSYT
ncbi:MAG: RHS repeat protein [Acidobacteria bacterium]|nr:RHS repeat protein [Acidobacteriota bacterium]MBI3658273.1 RHS repeat protein [Acidobacteriota bacterium]